MQKFSIIDSLKLTWDSAQQWSRALGLDQMQHLYNISACGVQSVAVEKFSPFFSISGEISLCFLYPRF